MQVSTSEASQVFEYMLSFFSQRPGFAMVIALIIAFSGAMALEVIPDKPFSQITPPVICVSVVDPGISNAAKAVREEIVSQTCALPQETIWQIKFDAGKPLTVTLQEIALSLLTILLVILALVWLFLKSLRATLIVALTIPVSLLAVFVPIVVLQGIPDESSRQFAVTLSAAIALSLCALTLTPAFCTRLLRRRVQPGEGPLAALNYAVVRARDGYIALSRRINCYALTTVAVILAAGIVTWLSYQQLPDNFLPQEDKGYLFVNVQLPDSAALPGTQQAMTDVPARYDYSWTGMFWQERAGNQDVLVCLAAVLPGILLIPLLWLLIQRLRKWIKRPRSKR